MRDLSTLARAKKYPGKSCGSRNNFHNHQGSLCSCSSPVNTRRIRHQQMFFVAKMGRSGLLISKIQEKTNVYYPRRNYKVGNKRRFNPQHKRLEAPYRRKSNNAIPADYQCREYATQFKIFPLIGLFSFHA